MAIAAIVGRPNVGKSTLFNRLIGQRKSIVEDVAGVTRDRIYGVARWGEREFVLVDTGGLDPLEQEGLFPLIRRQAMVAVEEADLILFVLDAQDGLLPGDLEIASLLRRSGKPVVAVVNKAEGGKGREALPSFHRLGMEPILAVSALHGAGTAEVAEAVAERLAALPPPAPVPEHDVRVAVVGRPNTGKSTLINRILGQERLLVSDQPGTTQDAVDTLVERDGRRYLFVDTAGIRRRSRIERDLERYSVVRSLAAVERCDVCLLLLDAADGLVEQDLRIAGLIEDRGKALVLVLNKWDLVEKDHRTFDETAKDLREKLFAFSHAPIVSLSGLTGQRVHRLFEAIEGVWAEATREVPTAQLNRALSEATERHPPPLVRGRRVRFFYGVQSGQRPPTFTLFTNRPGEIRENYVRYLERALREAFGFQGTPLRFRFRRGREGGRG